MIIVSVICNINAISYSNYGNTRNKMDTNHSSESFYGHQHAYTHILDFTRLIDNNKPYKPYKSLEMRDRAYAGGVHTPYTHNHTHTPYTHNHTHAPTHLHTRSHTHPQVQRLYTRYRFRLGRRTDQGTIPTPNFLYWHRIIGAVRSACLRKDLHRTETYEMEATFSVSLH